MTYRIESRVFKAASAVTAAEYSAFCTAYHQALIACGLVDNGDTGQFDYVSEALAETFASAARVKGYRVYKFNDSLQATSPVVIKIWYGICSTGVNAMPTVSIQVGFATDGAGNFVGLSTPIRYPHVTGSHTNIQVGTATTNAYSVGPGYFISALHNNFKTSVPAGAQRIGNVCHSFFAVVRTVDSNGEPTGDGVSLIYQAEKPLAATTAIVSNLKIDFLSVVNGLRQIPMTTIVPFADQLLTMSGSPVVYPILVPHAAQVVCNQVALFNTEVATAGDTFSHAMLGTTERNYYVPGKSFFPMDVGSTATTDPFPSYATVVFLLEGSAV